MKIGDYVICTERKRGLEDCDNLEVGRVYQIDDLNNEKFCLSLVTFCNEVCPKQIPLGWYSPNGLRLATGSEIGGESQKIREKYYSNTQPIKKGEPKMTEKMNAVVAKLETAVDKTVDYVTEHPVKTLVVAFVAAKIIKWLKD